MAQETITTKEILRQSLDRNRYFRNMLMTVRGFTMEQDHFTAKRLLSNRLLFGSGVICGLQVEKVGPDPTRTIEIKPGVALDPLGREVTVVEVPGGNKVELGRVIPKPEPAFTGDKTGFICLSHRECPKDPVPSLQSSPCDETCEASRWSETFDVTWEENTQTKPQPSLCEKWLNRTTAVAENPKFRAERTVPIWVRANDVFEVVVRVTAKQDATGIRVNETRTGGSLIEPTPPPSGLSQFPAPPVNLKSGEFFVYVYQVKSPAAVGSFQLAHNSGGFPALSSTIEVLSDADAKVREHELTIEVNSVEPSETLVRVAELTVRFTGGELEKINSIRNLDAPRFRYSLERVTEMLDCLRASVLTEAGSPRPGHAFITFNDLEKTDPKPVGPTPNVGLPFTAALSGHVHPLVRHEPSGLEFTGAGGNELWINGTVGGNSIDFLNPVLGQDPVNDRHLATKRYVDAHIAGLDWQESVLDKDLSAPPSGGIGDEKKVVSEKKKEKSKRDVIEIIKEGPGKGDRYLLFNGKLSGDWSGHTNDIATFAGKAWDFTAPDEGTAVFVEDENMAYLFVDGKWIPFLATPDVAAGDGLVADGAILSVGPGKGIIVNPNDVAVAFEDTQSLPVGPSASPGLADTSARGDHTHELPLAKEGGGLEFVDGTLQINGPIAGNAIEFQNTVSGQPPTDNRHLATKKYVDDQQSTITAGPGLIRKDDDISVGQGAGIRVNPDDVAVAFAENLPQPIGSVANAGKPVLVAASDHVHRLPLAENGGLEFVKEELRLNGLVAGDKIDFQRTVSGQPPTDQRHLATKKYVDDKVVPTTIIAGRGLTKTGNTLAVGEGAGLLVEEDIISVRLSNATPNPDSDSGDAGGNDPTAARGSHSHPLPKRTPGATTGLLNIRTNDNQVVTSDSIDPGLNDGNISVQLALTRGDNYFFDLDGRFIDMPQIKLGAEITVGKPTTFRVWAWIEQPPPRDGTVPSKELLPQSFQVRWFAYSPGAEIPEIEFDVIPNR